MLPDVTVPPASTRGEHLEFFTAAYTLLRIDQRVWTEREGAKEEPNLKKIAIAGVVQW
jgi:hypothetical protein